MADSNMDFLLSMRIDAAKAREEMQQLLTDFMKMAQQTPLEINVKQGGRQTKKVADQLQSALEKGVGDALDQKAGKDAGALMGRGLVEGMQKSFDELKGDMAASLKAAVSAAMAELAADTKKVVSELKTAADKAKSVQGATAAAAKKADVVKEEKPRKLGATGLTREQISQRAAERRAQEQADKEARDSARARLKESKDTLAEQAKNARENAAEFQRIARANAEIQKQLDRDAAKSSKETLRQQKLDKAAALAEALQMDRELERSRKQASIAAVPAKQKKSPQLSLRLDKETRDLFTAQRNDVASKSRDGNALPYLKDLGLDQYSGNVKRLLSAKFMKSPQNPDDATEKEDRRRVIRAAADSGKELQRALANKVTEITNAIHQITSAFQPESATKESVQLAQQSLIELKKRQATLFAVQKNLKTTLIDPAISNDNALDRTARVNGLVAPARDAMMREEFARRAQGLMARNAGFRGLSGSFNQDPTNPSQDEIGVTALKRFWSSQTRVRDAAASVGRNRGPQFDQRAAEELDAAQQTLLRRKDALEQALLSRTGQTTNPRGFFQALSNTPASVTTKEVVVPQLTKIGSTISDNGGVTSRQSLAAANQQISGILESVFKDSYARAALRAEKSGQAVPDFRRDYIPQILGGKASLSDQKSALVSAGVDKRKFEGENVTEQAQKIRAEFEKLATPLRPLVPIFNQLTDAIQKAGTEVEKLALKEAKAATNGRNLKQSIRDGLALFGGFSLGYTATSTLRGASQGFLQSEQTQADISAVFQNKQEGATLSSGSAELAKKYGASLIETANAAKSLAQAGLNARDAIKELETTLIASKGIGMSVEQVQELQLAVRSVTSDTEQYVKGIDYTRLALDRISAVERIAAVEGQDLANALKIVLPVADNFSKGMMGVAGAIDYVNGITTVMIERMRITGNQAGNVQKIFLSRLTNPAVLKKLQDTFGAKVGNAEGTDFLPLDQLVASLGERYKELAKNNPFQAKAFATTLSGGRNVSAITTLLENYKQVADYAAVSSLAFGDAQARANIATDTLNNTVERTKTTFQAMFNTMASGSGVAKGLRVVLSGLVSAMETIGTSSGPAIIASVLGMLGLAAAANKAFTAFKAASIGSSLLSGGLVTFLAELNPIVLTLSLVAAGLAGIGYIASATEKSLTSMADVLANVKPIKLEDIPQAQQLTQTLEKINPAASKDIGRYSDSVVDKLFGPNASAELKAFYDKLDKEAPTATGRGKNKLAEEFVALASNTIPDVKKAVDALGTSGVTVGQKLATAMTVIQDAVAVAGRSTQSQIVAMTTAIAEMEARALQAQKNIDDSQKGIRGFINRAVTEDFNTKQISPAYVKDYLGKDGLAQLPAAQALDSSDPGLANYAAKVLGEMLGRETAMRPDGKRKDFNMILDKMRRDPLVIGIRNAVDNNDQIFAARAQAQGGMSVDGAKAMTPEALQAYYRNGIQADSQDRLQTNTNLARMYAPNGVAVEQGKDVNKKLSGRIGESANLVLPEDRKGAGGGQIVTKFKDVLLDFLKRFTESLANFQFDKKFAADNGTAFDAPTARMEVAKQGLRSLSDFSGNNSPVQIGMLFEMLKKGDEARQASKGAGTRPLKRGESRQRAIQTAKAAEKGIQEQLRAFSNSNFAESLSGEAGTLLQKFFDDLFGGVFGSGIDLSSPTIRAKLTEVLTKSYQDDQAAVLARVSKGNTLDLQSTQLSNARSISDLLASPTDNKVDRSRSNIAGIREQAGIARQQLDNKRSTMSVDDYNEQLRTLLASTNEKVVQESQLTYATITAELQRQILTNVGQALSGVQSLTKDRSVLGDIFFPKGNDLIERAQNKAAAVRQAFAQALAPITNTIFDRVVDNFYKSLTESIYNNKALQGIFGLGETGAQKDQKEAANLMGSAILTNGTVVADLFASAIRGPGGIGSAETPGVPGIPGGTPNFVEGKTGNFGQRNKVLLTQLGVMGGGVLGGIAGRGGQFANMGSNFGSTAGAAFGASTLIKGLLGSGLSFLGGPIGGLIGGLAGGLIGKFFDKKQKPVDRPIIQALEAVERAQKETITTIQSQTEALLKPESRLINLPSTFNIPQYRPFSGSGGSQNTAGATVNNVQLTVNANGMTPRDAQMMVEDALANVMTDQRGRGPRVRRNT